MRVLWLASSFPRWDGDASGVFIRDAADAVAATGVDVHIVAPHDGRAARHEQLGALRVTRFRYAPARLEVLAHRGGLLAAARRPSGPLLVPLFLVAFLAAARQAVRRARPDLVHAHWWFPGGLVAALSGTPFVVTLHGSDVHLADRPLLRWLARWVLRRAAVVGVVSDDLGRTAVERLGVDPAVVVHLRMPVWRAPADGNAPPPSPPPVRLVAIGRSAPEKGFDVLLEAVDRLRADGLDVTLDLFGAGTEASGGHGERTRTELSAALARAHALVVPSRREGLGLVALEALAAGRPVIASRVGGLVEVVEDGVDGILVPPDDVDALAAAIRRLPLPPPGAAAVELHAADAIAAAHVAAYERVLTSRADRSRLT